MRLTLLLAVLLLPGCFRPANPTASAPAPDSRPATPPAKAEIPKATAPEEKDPFRRKVLEALRKCVDDPEGLEVVSWGTQVPIASGEFVLRFRARSPGGGKKLYDWHVQIAAGEVLRFWEQDALGNTRTIEVP